MLFFCGLPREGRAHRAMADAEMAAALLGRIRHDLRSRFGVPEPRHDLLMKLQVCGRNAVQNAIRTYLGN